MIRNKNQVLNRRGWDDAVRRGAHTMPRLINRQDSSIEVYYAVTQSRYAVSYVLQMRYNALTDLNSASSSSSFLNRGGLHNEFQTCALLERLAAVFCRINKPGMLADSGANYFQSNLLTQKTDGGDWFSVLIYFLDLDWWSLNSETQNHNGTKTSEGTKIK